MFSENKQKHYCRPNVDIDDMVVVLSVIALLTDEKNVKFIISVTRTPISGLE